MRLVVDSNIVIASLLRDGITRSLLMEAPMGFLAPEHMLGEIRKHRAAIAKRAHLSVAEFDLLFALVTEQLAIVAAESYSAQIQDAQQRIGELDPGDIPFLALALRSDCGIWTYNAKHFEGGGIRVWSTSDVAAWVRSASAA